MERTIPLLGAAAVAWSLGCNSIIGIDGDYVVGDRGGGATTASSSSGPGGASSTSAGGAGGSAGPGGEGAGGGTGGMPTCPTDGGPMVGIEAYCIDASEVTNTAYAAWLGETPDVAAQPAECAWNTSFVPASDWPAAPEAMNHPVTSVDWCDAYAFCAGQGKRLCGRLGAGPLAVADWNDPSKSQWFRACTADGANTYPYGDVFSKTTCNGSGFQPSGLADVEAAVDCHGTTPPYASLYDMSGNVDEWEDACSDATGASDTCRRRGGSHVSKETALRCDADASSMRSFVSGTTGFRCCAP